MPEQITLYRDAHNISPFCHRVEIALLEAGASYTSHGFNIRNKPAWFAQVNPLTGKIPAITYGGPHVQPEEPSPLSSKLTESYVILEFLADLFPNSQLLPPASNPTARARVRFFVDAVLRDVERPTFELPQGNPDTIEKIVKGLEKIQALLPDPDAPDGGEFAIGKDFTNADCALVPILESLDLAANPELGRFDPEISKKLGNALAAETFERLRRYKRAVWERESVKRVVDMDRIEGVWRIVFARN